MSLIDSHEIDFEIIGDDMQLVEIELDPAETVIAESGAMLYMDEDISFETKMGDGSSADSGLIDAFFSVGKRLLTKESLFITHFTHKGSGKKRVAFAAPYPGKIIPIDLAALGGPLVCQKNSFLCAAKGTKLSIAMAKKFGVGLFGGEGFILQRLEGNGKAFVHAGGTIVERKLNGESLKVDTGCLVAFGPGIEYDIEFVKGVKSMFFGGEGAFLANLRGTGSVWIQSLPFSRLADRVIANAPKAGGERQGEGSLLGQIFDLLGGR